MAVNMILVPEALRRHSAKWWHMPPPIFDGPPTAADREEARLLFAALDGESQWWYGRCRTREMFADLDQPSTPPPYR